MPISDDDYKKAYLAEVDSHQNTQLLYKNTIAFMERMKDQIKGYGSEITYLTGKVSNLIQTCESLEQDLRREKEKNTEQLKYITIFKEQNLSERRES